MRFYSCGLIVPGLFYPITQNTALLRSRPQQGWLDGKPYVIYKNQKNAPIVHSDVCPHQRASLSFGTLQHDSIVCPYHGFVFKEGEFCGIEGMTAQKGIKALTLLPATFDNACVYIVPYGIPHAHLPYQPPEERDNDFVALRGFRDLNCPHQCVTENVLDLLHISFVHSGTFGNRDLPLPKHIHYTPIDDMSGRTTFRYHPRPGSVSTWLQGTEVVVENEFHLPTTTITRVRVNGRDVKTVLTRAQPLDEKRTRLYWTLYRNFHTKSCFDPLARILMERTLDEDAVILSQLHHDSRFQEKPLHVRYDITIDKYREALKRATIV